MMKELYESDSGKNGVTEQTSTDSSGYLLDASQWDRNLAIHWAAQDDLELTESHWQVIDFLRQFYQQFETAPGMRMLLKALQKAYGDEFSTSRHLYQLFPLGPAKQACRYAGLPKPVSCI